MKAKKSFSHRKHKNDTKLSYKLWKIKASKEEQAKVRNSRHQRATSRIKIQHETMFILLQ